MFIFLAISLVCKALGDNAYNIEQWSDEGELFSQLQQSDCVKKALEILYPNCIDGVDGVSPGIKRNVAIELSKCEWIASGVAYPSTCLLSDNYETCVLDIHSSDQLWTTYSGNFRRTASYCYEFLVPMEKDQILQLYENITKIYTTFHGSIKNRNDEIHTMNDHISHQLQDLLDIVNQILDQWGDIFETSESYLVQLEEVLNTSIEVGLDSLSKAQDNARSEMDLMIELIVSSINSAVNSTVVDVIESLQQLESQSKDTCLTIQKDSREMMYEFSIELDGILTETKQLALEFQLQQELVNDFFQHQLADILRVMRSEYELSLLSLSDTLDSRTQEMLESLETKLEDEMVSYMTSIHQYMGLLNDTIVEISLLANATGVLFQSLKRLLPDFPTLLVRRLGSALWLSIVLLTVFRWGNFSVLIPFASGLLLMMYLFTSYNTQG
ncbi:karyogamy protein [Scheffersomyces spartinae]|uniref:Nuclear fusion protein KAR5 n=1 Tax=Scheffersomyces spartinae TaxID=45513 RepID=A0A9P8AKA9_9ASCO|nr:karyogamy protein [Scheffersomyces spartinae]KAG7195707.1 karyogamy protein [Scheffersomyces spartinae]